MKVVLDINVLISGLLWLGPSHNILKLAEEKKIDICFTASMVEELRQVLDRPKFIRRIKMCLSSTEELIATISKFALFFPEIDIPNIVKDDPDDNKIIACAEASGAEYIITGDPHLLKIKQFGSTFIINPREFLSIQKNL